MDFWNKLEVKYPGFEFEEQKDQSIIRVLPEYGRGSWNEE